MIVHDIEQGSYEWLLLRLGKVTGSRIKDVFKKDNLTLIDKLISEQLSGMVDDDSYQSDAMIRGLELEPVALDNYEETVGVKLIRGGFIQSSEMPLLGYSPDGRVGDIGGVEAKCPNSHNHIKYIRMDVVPVEYRWQVYGSFLINPKLEWYDFMSFDPRVPQRPVFIKRTMRSEIADELEVGKAELMKFFTKLEKYKNYILFDSE